MREYIFEAEKVDWLDAYRVHEVKGEIVRCKDCTHRDWDIIDIPYGLTKHKEWCSIRFNADGENVEVSPNDFCSKAESKVSSNFK